jgi:hypothetical protein
MVPETANPARDCGAAGLGIVTGLAGYDSRVSRTPQTDLQRAWLASRFPMPVDAETCRARLSLLSSLAFSTTARRA